jgi:predicted DNA-binding transcriptional regulator AlpA
MTIETAEKLLLTVTDLCRVLSISRSQFFCQRSLGRIPLTQIHIGQKLLFRSSEVRAWVEAGCPHRKHWQLMKETKP